MTRQWLTPVLTVLLLFSLGAPYAARAAETDVNTVLQQASKRLSDTQSMAFSMDISGSAWIDGQHTMKLQKAEGVMSRPNAVDVNFTLDVLGKNQVSIRMITIGDEAWITDLVTGSWVPAPKEFGFNPGVLYDNQNGLGPVMNRIQDAKVAGEEKVDGKNAYHVTGTIPQDIASKLSSGTLRGSIVGVDLWIDASTSDILQLKLSEPKDQNLDDPAVWTMHLSKHGEDVKIEKPN